MYNDNIQRLTQNYLTLSLEDIARSVSRRAALHPPEDNHRQTPGPADCPCTNFLIS